MLSVRQQAEVDRLLYEVENPDEVVQAVSKLETSQQLFALASDYNWDDGIEIPQAVSRHPLCDFATALLLFWRSDAAECFGAGSMTPAYQESWFNFCKAITRALLDGEYALGPNAYDPDLGRVQRYKLEKRGIPSVLLNPVLPECK